MAKDGGDITLLAGDVDEASGGGGGRVVGAEAPGADDEGVQPNGTETPHNTDGASVNFAFLTLLHGPRSCIGSHFARAEFACLLAGWVGRFEFELANCGNATPGKI